MCVPGRVSEYVSRLLFEKLFVAHHGGALHAHLKMVHRVHGATAQGSQRVQGHCCKRYIGFIGCKGQLYSCADARHAPCAPIHHHPMHPCSTCQHPVLPLKKAWGYIGVQGLHRVHAVRGV